MFFGKKILDSWIRLINKIQDKEVFHDHIWNNPLIMINKESFFWKSYFNEGFVFVCDLFGNDGNFLSFEYFTNSQVKTKE